VVTCPPARFLRHGHTYFTTVNRLIIQGTPGVKVPHECRTYASYQVAAVMVIYHRKRFNVRLSKNRRRSLIPRDDLKSKDIPLLESSNALKELETSVNDVEATRKNKKLTAEMPPSSESEKPKIDDDDKERENNAENNDEEKISSSKVVPEPKEPAHQSNSPKSLPAKDEKKHQIKIDMFPSSVALLAKISDIHTETFTWKDACRISKAYKQWIANEKAKLFQNLII